MLEIIVLSLMCWIAGLSKLQMVISASSTGPKGKNMNHLELQTFVSNEVQNSLVKPEKLQTANCVLRLTNFMENLLTEQTGGTREDESIDG